MAEQTNVKPIDFKYVDFFTCYSCKCEQQSINLEKHSMVCFSEVFGKVTGNTNYNIYVCKDPAILLKNKSNYCLLPLENIIKWLDYICDIVDIEYSISEDEMEYRDDLYRCYNIDINIDNNCNMCHKFLLTMIRYLYEWPFNVFLKDVFRLSDIEHFKNETLLNLHNMVFSSTQRGRNTGYGHSLTRCYANLLPDKEVKDSLYKKLSLNEIFGRTKYESNMHVIKDSCMLDYWESEEKFQKERLPIYSYNYDLLCKEIKEINNKIIK